MDGDLEGEEEFTEPHRVLQSHGELRGLEEGMQAGEAKGFALGYELESARAFEFGRLMGMARAVLQLQPGSRDLQCLDVLVKRLESEAVRGYWTAAANEAVNECMQELRLELGRVLGEF